MTSQRWRVLMAVEVVAGSRDDAYAAVSAALATSNVLRGDRPMRMILAPPDLVENVVEAWADITPAESDALPPTSAVRPAIGGVPADA